MSFTADIKQELVRSMPEKDCCMMAELNALTQSIGSLTLRSGGQVLLTFRTESLTVARHLLQMLRHGCRVQVRTRIDKNPRFGGRYVSTLMLGAEDSRRLLRRLNVIGKNDAGEEVFRGVPRRTVRRNCCRRAFIKGMFLGSGSVSAPGKGYHAEFVVADGARARFLTRVLDMTHVRSSVTERNGKAVVYLKDSEMISRLLAAMEASRAVLQIEEARTMGLVKKQVTRAMNCDGANLRKQLSAAQRQIAAIERISRLRGLSSLPEALENMARLRLAHQEATLEQLGALSEPPLTKSGVQQRLHKIEKLAEEIISHRPTEYKEE